MQELESDCIKSFIKNNKWTNIVLMECFMCKGKTERKLVNYFLDLGNTMIIIKYVPADVCIQCGERYFDDEVMSNLEKIVNGLKKLATEVSIVNYSEKVA